MQRRFSLRRSRNSDFEVADQPKSDRDDRLSDSRRRRTSYSPPKFRARRQPDHIEQPHQEAKEICWGSHFLQKVLDSIPTPIFYKDDQGVYLGGNRAFGDFLGRQIEDIVGKTDHDLNPRELAKVYELADQELFRTGGKQTYESLVIHADGTLHSVIFQKATFLNQDGSLGGLIGSLSDITYLKEIEERLRSSEAKYRRIFENIQDVYFEAELDGEILEISPSIERFFQIRRDNVIGHSIYDFYDEKKTRIDFMHELKHKQYVNDLEINFKFSRETPITCSITASILPGDGKRPPRIVGSLRNISKRKQAEEKLRQREEELSSKTRDLEELNTALKVLLKQLDEERKKIEENVLANVNASILPYIKKVREDTLTHHQKACLDVLEMQIKKIVSPFLRKISQDYSAFTPQEIRVADFVKNGNTTKEIASILGISMKTVDFHRDNIRKKLGIYGRHNTLKSFLMKLS